MKSCRGLYQFEPWDRPLRVVLGSQLEPPSMRLWLTVGGVLVSRLRDKPKGGDDEWVARWRASKQLLRI